MPPEVPPPQGLLPPHGLSRWVYLEAVDILREQGKLKKRSDLLSQSALVWYPQGDSNLYRQNRNLKSYPLDYGGKNKGTGDCSSLLTQS